jgi:hypothetical protein
MGLETALVVASVGSSVMQYQQQGAAGKFNQSVANRNAEIQRQEAQAIQDQAKFDLERADQDYQRLVGRTQVQLAKSGTTTEGTGQRIDFYNAKQKQLQDNIIQYNADISSAKKYEQANYSEIQGQMARQASKAAQLATITNLGTSLLGASKYMGSPTAGSSSSSFGYSGPSSYSGY